MGHARKFGAFNLYLILFVFFGSEVNICSEETVVGEFEVRYPIMYSHSSFCNVRFTNTINRIDKVIVSSSPFYFGKVTSSVIQYLSGKIISI